MAFVGMAGSGGYDVEKKAVLMPGESITVADYEITYDKLKSDRGANYTSIIAEISAKKSGKFFGKLNPAIATYKASNKRTSKIDIQRSLITDLYLALENVDTQRKMINLRILLKPLINWIWIGSIISVIGTGMVLISFYRKK